MTRELGRQDQRLLVAVDRPTQLGRLREAGHGAHHRAPRQRYGTQRDLGLRRDRGAKHSRRVVELNRCAGCLSGRGRAVRVVHESVQLAELGEPVGEEDGRARIRRCLAVVVPLGAACVGRLAGRGRVVVEALDHHAFVRAEERPEDHRGSGVGKHRLPEGEEAAHDERDRRRQAEHSRPAVAPQPVVRLPHPQEEPEHAPAEPGSSAAPSTRGAQPVPSTASVHSPTSNEIKSTAVADLSERSC